MNKDVTIRKANKLDTEPLSKLMKQLGYTMEARLLKDHLQLILQKNDHHLVVADRNGKLAGCIHGILSIRITSKPFIELVALVVDETEQGKGIGRRLIEHLLSASSDCRELRVRCNIKRNESLKFYEHVGFEPLKTQKVLKRTSNLHV